MQKVASDRASELLAARINEMPDEDYAQYLRYHFYICEKPELLGMTNQLECNPRTHLLESYTQVLSKQLMVKLR